MIEKADAAIECSVRPAANFEERPHDTPIDTLVLHYTGMCSAQAALDWLCATQSRVSCHYFVFEDGRIVQSVAEGQRAWHAGKSVWRGHDDINSRSVGVEIANPGHEFGYVAFPDAQIEAVIALCRDIVSRNEIAARNVVAHSDIAPLRKEDPGELFAWDRLSEAGVGLWVAPSPLVGGPELKAGDSGKAVRELQVSLAAYGYGVEASGEYDFATEKTVAAFQRHFRQQRVDGIADASTADTLRRVNELIGLFRRSAPENS